MLRSRLIGSAFLLIALATLLARLAGVPLGNGLANLPLGPQRPPLELTVWYSTEKEAWLKSAVDQFAQINPSAGGRPIRVTLVGMGSNEMVERVVKQDWRGNAPSVISPASMLQVKLLENQWQGGGTIVPGGADAPQPLVLTPLVLVGWSERANALWPNGPQPQTFWQTLHDALVDSNGWKAHGGQEQWGLVKFGHTSPLTSNSGTQTLLLMAYAFNKKTNGLSVQDVQNPEFIQWMREIEQAVPEFGESTNTFMNNMVLFGPSKYDFGMVYENLALEKLAATQGKLTIFYPPTTLLSEHPFALLGGSWVSPEQQQAARVLRAFLLSDAAQRLALQSGFRPANANVPISLNIPNNPFLNAQANGMQTNLGAQAEQPPADVAQALLDVWRAQVGR